MPLPAQCTALPASCWAVTVVTVECVDCQPSGRRCLLFPVWVEIVSLRKATGAPKVLVTDNGTEFLNKILVQVAEEYKILHMTAPPCHAQANPVECANRTLKQIIIAYLKGRVQSKMIKNTIFFIAEM